MKLSDNILAAIIRVGQVPGVRYADNSAEFGNRVDKIYMHEDIIVVEPMRDLPVVGTDTLVAYVPGEGPLI